MDRSLPFASAPLEAVCCRMNCSGGFSIGSEQFIGVCFAIDLPGADMNGAPVRLLRCANWHDKPARNKYDPLLSCLWFIQPRSCRRHRLTAVRSYRNNTCSNQRVSTRFDSVTGNIAGIRSTRVSNARYLLGPSNRHSDRLETVSIGVT
jgi:hypothetical protein